MLVLLAVNFYIILFSYVLSRLTKVRIMESAPISMFFAMIWMTFFGMLNKLQLGAILLLPMIIFATLLLVKSKPGIIDLKNLKQLISFPVLGFVAITAWSYVNTQNMQFIEWDEFTHWGTSVKSMFYFDVIGPYSPARLNNPGYPPGLAVLSYLILQLRNDWDESIVFWTYHLMFFSIIFAVIARFNFKQIWYAFVSLIILFVSSIIFFDFFQTVYADPILAVVFGYSLFLAVDKRVTSNKFFFINFLITNSALFLIKEIGFVLGAISSLVFMTNFVFSQKNLRLKDTKNLITIVSYSLLSIGVLLISRFTWTTFICSRNYRQGESIDTTCGANAASSILPGGSGIDNSLFSSYLQNIFNKPITFWNGIQLTSIDWILIIIFLLFLVVLDSSGDKIRKIAISIALIVGAPIYFGAVFIAYLSFFGTTAQGFPSFDRYASTYISGVIFFIATQSSIAIYNITKNVNISKQFKIPKIAFAMSLLVIFYSPQGRLVYYAKDPNVISDQIRSQFFNIKQKIEFAKFSTEDNIYVITQHKMGFEYFYIQYETLPASVGAMPFSIGSKGGDSDIWTDPNMTLSAWNKTLDDFDYVILYNISESFVKEYGSIFASLDQIEEQSIYLIEHTESGNRLVKYV